MFDMNGFNYFMQKGKKKKKHREKRERQNDLQSEVVDILLDPWKKCLLCRIYFYVGFFHLFIPIFIFAVCKR